MIKVTTCSNSRSYYHDIFMPVTTSEVEYPSMGERCKNAEHDHAPIYCLPHGQTDSEHVVGGICLDCDKQWFYAPDWSSPECRAMADRVSPLRLLLSRIKKWFR